MSAITFDTLKYAQALRDAGIPDTQAHAFVRAQREILSEALDTQLANRTDVERVERKLVEQDGKFTLLQWMIAFNLAFTMAVLWKMLGR